jgi:hypothetical protein
VDWIGLAHDTNSLLRGSAPNVVRAVGLRATGPVAVNTPEPGSYIFLFKVCIRVALTM